MQGRIIKQISNDYTVLTDQQTYICKCRGIFRKDNITPLVGDFVHFSQEKRLIEEILPRKNELIRPPVANIDQAIIITSLKEPDFSTNLLDKLLSIIEYNRIKPVIILTKMDLLTESERKRMDPIIQYYATLYSVYFNDDLEEIEECLKEKVSVFTGQSGAGKSTLLNQLDPELHIATGAISKALGRGKHTTRHVELIRLYGGLVADTPGFSSIDFKGMTLEDIRNSFPEMREFNCEYRDCMHINEQNCEVKRLVSENKILKSRYENYLKFIGK